MQIFGRKNVSRTAGERNIVVGTSTMKSAIEQINELKLRFHDAFDWHSSTRAAVDRKCIYAN